MGASPKITPERALTTSGEQATCPAAIGADPKAGVVAVPILTGDRVELWRLPARVK
jgi:hypothetical protein